MKSIKSIKLPEIIEYNDIKIKNYTALTGEEKKEILTTRNHPSIKKWMYTNTEISYKDHIKFINGLKTSKDKLYWKVEQNNNYIGSIFLDKISFYNLNAKWGCFVSQKFLNSGKGILLEYHLIKISFEKIGLNLLIGEIFNENERIERLQHWFRFKKDGMLRDRIWNEGLEKYISIQVFSLLKSEYKTWPQNIIKFCERL